MKMINWKSLYIYYLSGTGNARASSAWIADEAEKKGLKVVVQQIDRLENIKMPDPDDNPLIGFAFPNMYQRMSDQVNKTCKKQTILDAYM